MNPFSSRIPARSQFAKEQWVVPVSAMCLVLGFMISMAWVNDKTRPSRFPYLPADQRPRVSEASVDYEAYQRTQEQVNQLQAEKTKLENAIAGRNSQTKVLNDSLQETKMFAGLVPVEGQGVSVTLKDSAKAPTQVQGNMSLLIPDASNVHDLDVLRLVNELFNAGAEAVAVNKERIIGVSNIRCVGTTIMVNDVKVAPPIIIRAIGDSQTLIGGLNINGGVVEEIREQDPAMVEIVPVKSMRLPAYTGKTGFRVATPAKEAK